MSKLQSTYLRTVILCLFLFSQAYGFVGEAYAYFYAIGSKKGTKTGGKKLSDETAEAVAEGSKTLTTGGASKAKNSASGDEEDEDGTPPGPDQDKSGGDNQGNGEASGGSAASGGGGNVGDSAKNLGSSDQATRKNKTNYNQKMEMASPETDSEQGSSTDAPSKPEDEDKTAMSSGRRTPAQIIQEAEISASIDRMRNFFPSGFLESIEAGNISEKSVVQMFKMTERQWKKYKQSKNFSGFDDQWKKKGISLKGLDFVAASKTIREKLDSAEKGPEKDALERLTANFFGKGFLANIRKEKTKANPLSNPFLMGLFCQSAGLKISYVPVRGSSAETLHLANWLSFSSGKNTIFDMAYNDPWDSKNQTVQVLKNDEVLSLPVRQALESTDPVQGFSWAKIVDGKKDWEGIFVHKKIKQKPKQEIANQLAEKDATLQKSLDDLKKLLG